MSRPTWPTRSSPCSRGTGRKKNEPGGESRSFDESDHPRDEKGRFVCKTLDAAGKRFPGEKWKEEKKNLFVAESRGKKNKNEKAKLEKEIKQASVLTEKGHEVCLTPENGNGKHFDGLIDGNNTLELKTVDGNIKMVGKNFKDGVKKAEVIFLQINEDFRRSSIYSKCKGELSDMKKRGEKILGKKLLVRIRDKDIYEIDLTSMI